MRSPLAIARAPRTLWHWFAYRFQLINTCATLRAGEQDRRYLASCFPPATAALRQLDRDLAALRVRRAMLLNAIRKD